MCSPVHASALIVKIIQIGLHETLANTTFCLYVIVKLKAISPPLIVHAIKLKYIEAFEIMVED